MEHDEFNSDFASYLSEKLLQEKNENMVLMDDFNVDFLKYETDVNNANFLDQIYTLSKLK